MKMYRGSADPEAQLQQQLANMPNAPQWTRDALEQNTRRCISLANGDPFEGLPKVDGGYTSSYWHERAVKEGDPRALAQSAGNAMAQVSTSPNISSDQKAAQVLIAQSNLRTVVESGDPDALYSAAMLVANPSYSSNPLNAAAVALATCDLGHDCSADNPDNSFYNCKLSGACPANADYAYFLQQSLGPDSYAQVYAQSLQVKQSIEHGDVTAILMNLKFDRF
jgi:hypothetical protein